MLRNWKNCFHDKKHTKRGYQNAISLKNAVQNVIISVTNWGIFEINHYLCALYYNSGKLVNNNNY